MLFMASIVISSCASYNVKRMYKVPGGGWALSKEQSGISVSLKKYSKSTETQDKYPFDKNLNSESILPIRLLITNHSLKDIVVKRKSFLLKDAKNQYSLLAVNDIYTRIRYSPFWHYFGWGVICLPAGLIEHENAEKSNEKIIDDLKSKSLNSKVLGPRRSTDGFLFFNMPEDIQHTKLTMIVSIKDREENQTIFEFAIPASQ